MNRMAQVKRLPCIACVIERVAHQPSPSEVHHLNLGGKAGQKRRGNRYTITLCSWHHRGEPINHVDATAMAALYGPSLARQSKLFRAVYGTDDGLLEKVDELLNKTRAA